MWVPSVYTSPGMYLVNHPVNLGAQVRTFTNGLREKEKKVGDTCVNLFGQDIQYFLYSHGSMNRI